MPVCTCSDVVPSIDVDECVVEHDWLICREDYGVISRNLVKRRRETIHFSWSNIKVNTLYLFEVEVRMEFYSF